MGEIERVSHSKLLGVIIDVDLKWESHVQFLCKKLSQRSLLIKHFSKRGYNSEELFLIFQSLFLSILTYALPAWGGSLNKRIRKPIEILIKRMQRILPEENLGTFSDLILQFDAVLFDKFKKQDKF
jgi:hypothetical protein